MSASRRRLVAPLALLCLLAAATLAAAPRGSSINLRTPRWTFSRSSLSLAIEQKGPLAGRHLVVLVFVDENMVGQVTTRADRTETRLGDLELASGDHTLKIKAGTEEATARFGVLSPILPLGIVAAALAILLGARLLKGRRAP